VPQSSVDVSRRMSAVLDYVATGHEDDLRPHYLDRVSEMLADISDIDNLLTTELATLVALLIPAHSRALSRRIGTTNEPDGNRVLRLVVPHSQPPAQLG
jgi:hypothetical protein